MNPLLTRQNLPLRQHLARRAGGSLIIIFLVVLLAIVIVAKFFWKDEQKKRTKIMVMAMDDPKISLERYLLERQRDYVYAQEAWRNLFEFMSQEDMDWFKQHYTTIAQLNQQTGGAVIMAATQGEQEYSALQVLTRFGLQTEQLVVSQVQENGDKCVAYVHPPNTLQGLREVFLIKENGLWKIRRFMGARDTSYILEDIVAGKKVANQPLTADEEAWGNNAEQFLTSKRNELLAEVGLTNGLPTPVVTPPPTPPMLGQIPPAQQQYAR